MCHAANQIYDLQYQLKKVLQVHKDQKKIIIRKNQGHDGGLIHDLKHWKLEFQKAAKQREYMQ